MSKPKAKVETLSEDEFDEALKTMKKTLKAVVHKTPAYDILKNFWDSKQNFGKANLGKVTPEQFDATVRALGKMMINSKYAWCDETETDKIDKEGKPIKKPKPLIEYVARNKEGREILLRKI